MSAPEPVRRGGVLLGVLGSPVRVAYATVVALFLWAVAQFYSPETGFTSMLSIGDMLTEVTTLKQVPHYTYESSMGYDGAYYAQLALHPTLDNPELATAIDNLPYRAKRILFSWVSWLLGFGQPTSVLQAHALLNVVCWLGFAWLLLRWFPATSWENFFRWASLMLSHGVCMSVRHSLVDLPSLLLIALGMRWLQDGRAKAGAVTLALAGLGKETSLLATAGLEFDWRAPRTWPRVALRVGLIALPLVAWMGYVRWKFGPAGDPGLGNFTRPFVGYAEKFLLSCRDAFGRDGSSLHWASLAAVVALCVQWIFFALWRRPGERWWRIGAAFAGMTVFLSTPVWEGYPGAATRVLLPMALAFNLLVPRGVRWLPVLIAGNLTVAASVFEFSPPHEFHTLRGESAARAALRVIPSKGWYGPERHLEQHWRWSRGSSEVRFVNQGTHPLRVAVQGYAGSANDSRRLRVSLGERMLWSEDLKPESREMRFGFTLPPGESILTFASDLPPRKVGGDPRDLAFRVTNLEISVRTASTPP